MARLELRGAVSATCSTRLAKQPTRRALVERAHGGVPERSNGVVSKTIVGLAYRGFESLPLRPWGMACRIFASNGSRHYHTVLPSVVMLCATLLPCAGSHAQLPDLGRLYQPVPRPPGIRYQMLESEHFQIIFQQGAEPEAREAAAVLEHELPKAEAITGHSRPMRMPVILNAYNDRSNGFVTTLPFRQEIESSSIKGQRLSARYTSWMQAVVPHELVHATQAHSHAGFGIGGLLRLVSPDLARSLNLGLPPGLSEGAAVYHESTVQEGAGRLNFSLFQMQFRAAMSSKRPWSLAQILELPAYSYPASRHYSGGANLFAHLARDDGGEFFRVTKALHYRLPLFGTGIELWRSTGMMPRRLGTTFRQEMKALEAARQASLGPVTSGHLVATGPGRSHRRPQWLNDSTVVAHVSGYDMRTGFYLVDMASGSLLPVAYQSVTGDASFSLSRDGDALLFSRYVRDLHVASQWVSDAFQLELATRKMRRLTRGQRVFFPVQGRSRMWAIQNQGQFTGWVQIGKGGTVERISKPMRATFIQVVPSPDGEEAAVLLRQEGRQGIYRAIWRGGDEPELEPWIVFKHASIYDASWHGQYLLFTADPGGVANVFAAFGSQLVQLTNARFGAMEPSLSPDHGTLAYVEYAHERYDLKTALFDVAKARPVPASQLLSIVPRVPRVVPLTGGAVVPYRAARHLRPRTLLPDFLDSGNGNPWDGALGVGPGLTLQGADPLRRWAYALGAHYQAERMWYSLGLATHLGGVRTDLEVYTEPGTAVVVSGERVAAETVGQEHRGARLGLSLPVFADSNIRNTTLHVALAGTFSENRLFALPGKTLPQVPLEWRSFKSRLTLGPTVYLRYRTSRNVRDLMSNSGTTLSVSADWDLWEEREGDRSGMTARVAQYFSLSHRTHTGIRLRATLVAQSIPGIYNLEYFAPRGYEYEHFSARSYVGLDGLVMQPLWFIDNGLVLLPIYLKVLFAYGFAEFLYGSESDVRYRAVGAGLGLQLRLIHHLNLEFRLGCSYLIDADRLRWTLR